jgi:hypothetical protein
MDKACNRHLGLVSLRLNMILCTATEEGDLLPRTVGSVSGIGRMPFCSFQSAGWRGTARFWDV